MTRLLDASRLDLVRRQVRPVRHISFYHVATLRGGIRVYKGLEDAYWTDNPPITQHVYEFWRRSK